MPSAWVRQDPEQVAKVGTEKASWYCHWLEPGRRQRCKSCGTGPAGKALAEELKLQIERDLTLGTYEPNANRPWSEFRREYEAKVLPGRAADTQRRVRRCLDNFERLARPHKMAGLRTKTLDDYAAARRLERVRRRKGEAPPVAPGTVAQELSDLKAVLRVARRWGYLAEVPEVPQVKLPRKLPRYVTPEHFAALYLHADAMTFPRPVQGYACGDWWRALLAFVYVATGWRIGQCLGLEWSDVDLAAGTVVGRHSVTGNKADRDVLVRLHPVAIEHLTPLRGFAPRVFPWPHLGVELRRQLARLCRLAGVPRYGWHDFRRGFCTLNAPRLTPMELQHLAQHANLATTQRFYVNPLAAQDDAVTRLHVPDVLRRRTG